MLANLAGASNAGEEGKALASALSAQGKKHMMRTNEVYSHMFFELSLCFFLHDVCFFTWLED